MISSGSMYRWPISQPLALTLPFIVCQIWQFVGPALKEEGGLCQSLPTSQLALFALLLGLAFGYFFVSPAIFRVLMRLERRTV